MAKSKASEVEGPNNQHHQNVTHRFDDIFEQYQRPIYGYLLRITGNPTEAEDLTQETFIKVSRSLQSFRNDSSLSTWLYRLATNVSNDYFRHKQTSMAKKAVSLENEKSPGEQIIDDESVSLEKSAERDEMSSCVQDFVSRLPVNYRMVLVLHDEQGFKNPEIAEVLGCSLETVKIRLHRARKQLRCMLNEACHFAYDERNVLVCESTPETVEKQGSTVKNSQCNKK